MYLLLILMKQESLLFDRLILLLIVLGPWWLCNAHRTPCENRHYAAQKNCFGENLERANPNQMFSMSNSRGCGFKTLISWLMTYFVAKNNPSPTQLNLILGWRRYSMVSSHIPKRSQEKKGRTNNKPRKLMKNGQAYLANEETIADAVCHVQRMRCLKIGWWLCQVSHGCS